MACVSLIVQLHHVVRHCGKHRSCRVTVCLRNTLQRAAINPELLDTAQSTSAAPHCVSQCCCKRHIARPENILHHRQRRFRNYRILRVLVLGSSEASETVTTRSSSAPALSNSSFSCGFTLTAAIALAVSCGKAIMARSSIRPKPTATKIRYNIAWITRLCVL